MQVKLVYQGRSQLVEPSGGGSRILGLAPNLARSSVAFDAGVVDPVRFREGLSTLHAVVVSDLAYHPKDRSAYFAWREDQRKQQLALQARLLHQMQAEAKARAGTIEPEFEGHYRTLRGRYWRARDLYTAALAVTAPDLWRQLVPLDPVVTVADDVVFFEAFSRDESSYGCLTFERATSFQGGDLQTGTTNVDYSQDLYNAVQLLRSYRTTRFKVDPQGIGLSTDEASYREEKIDLPPSWLQGFLQTQAAMTLPMITLRLPRGVVYSLLAFLKRNKARHSPRAIRFELIEGQPIRVVLEPWETEIVAHGTRYTGPEVEPIRIWGRQRLLVLERMLPWAEDFEVGLVGSGLPSFWVARAGAMRFVLGLSGWTANDWTRSTALDLLAPPANPSAAEQSAVAELLAAQGQGSVDGLSQQSTLPAATVSAVLNHLARQGQVIYDLAAATFLSSVMNRARASRAPRKIPGKARTLLIWLG